MYDFWLLWVYFHPFIMYVMLHGYNIHTIQSLKKSSIISFSSQLFFFLFYKSLNRGRKSSQFVQPICLESRTYGDHIIQPNCDERNLRSELRYWFCTFLRYQLLLLMFWYRFIDGFFFLFKYTEKDTHSTTPVMIFFPSLHSLFVSRLYFGCWVNIFWVEVLYKVLI